MGAATDTRAVVNNGAANTHPEGFAGGTYSFGMFIYNSHEGEDAHQPFVTGHDDITATAIVTNTATEYTANWSFSYNPTGGNGSLRTYATLGVPKDKSGVVVAYYPHATGITAPHSIPFDTGKQTDYLWAEPQRFGGDENNGAYEIKLAFKHVMTCIEVQLKNMYTGNITLTDITLTDTRAAEDGTNSCLYASGNFDAYNGEIDANSCVKTKSIRLSGATIGSGNYSSFYFIVPEIQATELEANRLQLTFTFNTTETAVYTLPLTVGGVNLTQTGYQTGHRYQYLFTVDNTMKFVPGEISQKPSDQWETAEEETDIPI